jgi:hypothetical protein
MGMKSYCRWKKPFDHWMAYFWPAAGNREAEVWLYICINEALQRWERERYDEVNRRSVLIIQLGFRASYVKLFWLNLRLTLLQLARFANRELLSVPFDVSWSNLKGSSGHRFWEIVTLTYSYLMDTVSDVLLQADKGIWRIQIRNRFC